MSQLKEMAAGSGTNLNGAAGSIDGVGSSAANAAGDVAALNDQLERLTGLSMAGDAAQMQAVQAAQQSGNQAMKQAALAGNTGEAIKGYAGGGVVTKPQLAMVGERGPEAIIPLNQPFANAIADVVTKLPASHGVAAGGMAGASAGVGRQVGTTNPLQTAFTALQGFGWTASSPAMPTTSMDTADKKGLNLWRSMVDLLVAGNDVRAAMARDIARMSGEISELRRVLTPAGGI
jgi:hypothetical protein